MKAVLTCAAVAALVLATRADNQCQKTEFSCKDTGSKCDGDMLYNLDKCTNNTQCCKFPLLCVDGTCRDNYEDAACTNDYDCRGSVYDTQLFACIDGKCMLQGSFGDSCTNDTHCSGDMVCKNKVCQGLAENAACLAPRTGLLGDKTNFQCAKGLTCSRNKCAKAVERGGKCAMDSECDVYSVCSDGVCIAPWSKAKGDKCTHSDACRSGLYCYLVESECRETVPARTLECTNDTQCASYGNTSKCSVCDTATGKTYCSDPINVARDCVAELSAAYECYRAKGCAPKPSSSLDTCAQLQCTAETNAVFACKSRCQAYKDQRGTGCVASSLLRYCPIIQTWLKITIAFAILVLIIVTVFIVYGIFRCARKPKYQKISAVSYDGNSRFGSETSGSTKG